MSLGSILSVARGAIFAHQTASAVVAQNIANAETEGYSRQRANLITGIPTQMPYGAIGTGVVVSGVTRMRSEALDVNYRSQASGLAGATVRQDVLTEVQGIFGEPQDQGLADALDKFWSAWSDLSNSPSNGPAQAVVRQRGANLSAMLNQYASRLTEVTTNTAATLQSNITTANQLATQVASLNDEITSAESGGVQAPDLRDQRDRVADQLAKLTGARAMSQANGTYSIVIGGTTIVDGSNARPMSVSKTGNTYGVTVGTSPDAVQALGGEAGAMVTLLNTDLPAVGGKLDALAKGLVDGVNYLHRQGWTAAGEQLQTARGVTMNWDPTLGATGPGIDFFDASHVDAASIALSADVLADSSVIASGITQNGPADNSLALQMAALRDGTGMQSLSGSLGSNPIVGSNVSSTTSYAEFYRGVVTQLGLDTAAASTAFSASDALTSQAATRREQVFGVSMDEELTNLMRHQQAFSAAAKLVSTVDEMMQTVLEMV